MGRQQRQNSGTTGGGWTLTGLANGKSRISSMRNDPPKPPPAPKGVKRPTK